MIASAARSHARHVYKAIIGCRCLLNSRYVWDGMVKKLSFCSVDPWCRETQFESS